MHLYLISFSPTGSTRRVLELMAKGWDNEPFEVVELCSAEPVRLIAFAPEDVCLVGAPVYAGRIPAMQADRLRELFGQAGKNRGNGCRVVGVAVYGNRDFDDALVELRDILVEGGCRFVAGVTAVAEHSIVRKYGAGRPDEADAGELRSFGEKIRESLQRETPIEPPIPGKRPYKEGIKSGPHPLPDESCVRCGQCAKMCPAAAISADGQQLNAEKCISCMRCISVCPKGARHLPAEQLSALEQHLKPVCSERKENKLYL